MADEDDYTVDPSTCDEGVTIIDDVNSKSGKVTSRATKDFDVNPKIKKSFSINRKYEDKRLGPRTVTGSLTLNCNCYIKVYSTLSYKYLELRIEYSNQISISTSGSVAPEPLRLTEFIITPVAGLSIYFLPSLVFKMSGTLSISGSLKGTVGVSYSSDEGSKNLSSTPKFNAGINVSGSVFIGLNVEIGLGVLGKVIKMSLIGKLGTDISSCGSTTISKSTSKIHEGSALCVAGEINGKIGLDYNITFLNNDKLSLSGTVAEFSIKLFDFYYCTEHDEFALTTCPRVKYLVNVSAVDRNGKPISGATVNNSYTTNENGVASFYLPKGNHAIKIRKGSKFTRTIIHITNKSVKVDVNIDNGTNCNIVQIQGHDFSSAALMDDGTLYMWGDDVSMNSGTLSADEKSPVKINGIGGVIPEYSVKYVEIYSGNTGGAKYYAVITDDGNLYMWGNNDCGQLGDGTTTYRTSPIKVLDKVKCVSLGEAHTAAIREDGSLYMWGDNYKGQLGDGTTISKYKPQKIMDKVKSVSLSYDQSSAITETGTLYTWGRNSSGQLGNNITEDSYKPVEIMTNVKSVDLGTSNGAAITENGSLYLWGNNRYGLLGKETYLNQLKPVPKPVKIADNIDSVSLKYSYCSMITVDGTLYTYKGIEPTKLWDGVVSTIGTGFIITDRKAFVWDDTDNGIFINEIELRDNTPSLTGNGIEYNADLSNINYDFTSIGEVKQIEAGQNVTAVVMKDGSLYMCGYNNWGQLGNGTLTNSSRLIKIMDDVESVSLGENHSAAIKKDGSLYMWGASYYGQLGNCTLTYSLKPVKVLDDVIQVSLGGDTSAAIKEDGSLYIWGDNRYGQLGLGGESPYSTAPVEVKEIKKEIKSVSLGEVHSAAITTDNELYMWGDNGSYEIDRKLSNEIRCRLPVKVMGNVNSVDLGNRYSSAITVDGSLYMWGSYSSGELGNNSIYYNNSQKFRIANNVAKTSLGTSTSSALSKDGGLYIWGSNYHGLISNETTVNKIAFPTYIMNNIVSVSMGANHIIVLCKDGTVYTWGYNGAGQLGNGTTTASRKPIELTLPTITNINKTSKSTAVSSGSTKTKTVPSHSTALKTVSSGSATIKTATFSGLMPEQVYNFYSVKTKETKDVLNSDNLLYIEQITTDKNGCITISYYPDEDYATPYEFVTSLARTDISSLDITIPTINYNGNEHSVNPVIKDNDKLLVCDVDYEITEISKVINIGEYTAKISGKGDYTGTVEITYTVSPRQINNLKISHPTKVDYTGSQLTPAVVVTDGDKTLEENTDYTIAYTNNTNVGTGKITITGIGNYAGKKVSTFEIIGTGTEQPTTNNYYVTGDIEMKLSTCGTNKVNGKIALQAGTYKIKLNNNGTLLGYGKTVTNTTGGLTFKSTFNSYMTLKATVGIYTFQVNTDTNALVIKHDSNLPKEYLTGDLNTILTPVKGRTLSIGTTYLEAGTYNFKLSIDGVAFGYGKTVNDKTSGSLSFNSKYASSLTLVATGGTYTFTLNTATNKLLINHIPAKDEANNDIHLSGDFDLVLDDNGGTDNVAVGTVDLEEGTYSFKLYNYGQALTAGVKITDKGTKTLYGNYITPVTLIASGGTYKFSFNKTTNVLTVEKA
ncbi:MAG: hypothetical protein U0O22_08270 [Acutalibacteraceae bacterium]